MFFTIQVSAKELRNVGISALAAAFTLTAADEPTTLRLISEVCGNALERLETEYALSRSAIRRDSATQAELHILRSWGKWYEGALTSMQNIYTRGRTPAINQAIAISVQAVRKRTTGLVRLLQEHSRD